MTDRREFGLQQGQRFSVLRDAVHGDVYLSGEEIELLDTPQMQRLRGIKQLGTADRVFPGATHTRFEHSIGTLHVTQKLIEGIRLNAQLEPRHSLGVSDSEARSIRAASLLHDVTHIPFGHNIEDQTGLLPRHDEPERFNDMLAAGPDGTELGRVLARLELDQDVIRILTSGGIHPDDPLPGDIPPFWAQVVSDTICSDLVDYLARDAHYTGLNLGVDQRILNYFRIDRDSRNLYIDLAKRNLLREDILSEVVRLLEARYYFSERVYYHHAKVSAGALIGRAVELALVSGVIVDRDLFGVTEAGLFELLDRRSADAEPETGRRIRHLVQNLRERRLYKRACVYTRADNAEAQSELVARFFSRGSQSRRQAAEARIADRVQASTGASVDIVLVCPARRMQLKEVQTHVRWPGEKDVRPLSEYSERVPRLGDLERAYRDLWKFYVLADSSDRNLLERIGAIASEELPGTKNGYRP